jgi:hypothetical protein
VLPMCNDRPALIRLLDDYRRPVDAASQLRLVRMRGRHPGDLAALHASAAWQGARQWLERAAAKPELRFESGG